MMQPHILAKENGSAATGAAVLPDPQAESAVIETDQVNPTPGPKKRSGIPAAEATADDDMLPPNSKAPARTAQINRGVNMRTRPESGSSVLTVVPKAANV